MFGWVLNTPPDFLIVQCHIEGFSKPIKLNRNQNGGEIVLFLSTEDILL